MLTFIEESPGSWVFIHESPEGAEEQFDSSLELFDAGELDEAEYLFRNLLLVCPDHIDALHHLALVFEHIGRDLEAYLCTREAVRIGLDAIPSKFSWLSSRLFWGHLANRPFMRAYHSLGLHLLRLQQYSEALEIFARLVSINPNDNLGARYILMECLLNMADWDSAVMLALKYPNDTGPDIAYSKVVALIHQEQRKEATECLKVAIKHSPNVAAELVKVRHSRPKPKHPGYFVSGGDEEAFDYWERNSQHWAKNSDAYQLLCKVAKHKG